jgi:hypothetical protein
MVTLRDFLSDVETRKAKLGMLDTPAGTEAMRNRGTRRTAKKRELLRRAEERARAAGKAPVPAYY